MDRTPGRSGYVAALAARRAGVVNGRIAPWHGPVIVGLLVLLYVIGLIDKWRRDE